MALALVLLIPLHVPVSQMMVYARWLSWIVVLLSAAAGVAGAFLVSSREPGLNQTITDRVLRWLLRLTCLAWSVVVTLLYLVERWEPLRLMELPSEWFTPLTFELLWYTLSAVSLYAIFAQLEHVARRIDQPELTRWFILFRVLVPLLVAAPLFLRVPGLLDLSSQAAAALRLAQHVLPIASLFVLGRLYHALRLATPPRLR